MKTFRLFAGLLAAALFTPLALAQDNSEVASLLAKARRGNGIAQYNLGLAYSEGRGVTADPVEAFVWLSLARENGARGRDLDLIVTSLDRTTLELAQRRLAERKTELGARPAPPTAVTARPETPAAKEPTAAVAPAPSTPATPSIDDVVARLQADREALSTRLAAAAADLAALRTERDNLIKVSAEHDKAARLAQARVSELAKAAAAATMSSASKNGADAAALEQKNRELQTALADLEEARKFGRQVEDTLNRVNDEKARTELAAKAELEEARKFGRQVEDTLNRVNDEKAKTEVAAKTELEAARSFGQQVEATLNKVMDQKTALETSLRTAEARLSALQGQAAGATVDAKTLADLKSTNASLTAQINQLQSQIASIAQARDAALAAAAAKPDLSGKVQQLQDQKTALASQLAQSREQITGLTHDLAAAKNTVPAYPDLRGQVASLQSDLADTKKALATKSSGPAYPDLSGKVADLATQLAAAKNTAPAYPNLSGKVTELEAALAAEQVRAKQEIATLTKARETAEKSLAAKPAYPDLRGNVTELETKIAALTQSNETVQRNLSRELDSTKAALAKANDSLAAKPAYPDLRSQVAGLESDLASTRKALAEKPAAPSYPNLADKVAELTAQLAAAEADRAKLEVAALTKAKEAKPSYPDLSGKVADLTATIDKLTRDNTRLTAASQAAPAYPDLRGQVATLESGLASARKSLAEKPAGPSYPNLSGRVAELETQLAAKPAAPSYPDLRDRVTTLEAELTAAKHAAPAYPDLRDRVSSLEGELTAAKTALAVKPNAPAYSDLSGKVAELEASLALATQKVAAAEQARSATIQQFDDYRSSSAAATRERTTLLANLKLLESDKASLRRQAESAGNEAAQLRTQVATLKEQVAAKPAAPSYPDLSGKVAELTAQLAAKPAAPAYPDLSGRVSELEGQLAAKPAAPAYPNLSGRVADLESQLTASQGRIEQLQASLAAKPAAPAYPDLSSKVAQLESLLAAKPAAPNYPDISAKVAELAAQLAAKPAAPSYPDLSRHVAELESALNDSGRKLAAAETVQLDLKHDLAEAQAAAKPAGGDVQLRRERDELSGRVTDLAAEVAQLRGDRERMQKMLSDAGRQLRDATADASRIKQLEAQVEAQQNALGASQTRVNELQAAVAAKPVAPAYPDLSGRVRALEAQLAALSAEANTAKEQVASLSKAKEEAEHTAAAKPAAPSYPDLSGRVTELEASLAEARRPAKTSAPAYPDLSGRVSELEASLARSQRQLTDLSSEASRAKQEVRTLTKANEEAPAASQTTAAPAADTSALEKKLADAEDRLNTALRGYALLEKDRDALKARSGQVIETANSEKSALADKLAALTAEVEQLKASAATQVSGDKLAAAQAEAARAGAALAALQRSTGQVSTEAAANRTLVQQLQGANAVLAQENYQLKTMISRTTGGPAPAGTLAAPLPPPGTRLHLVVAGDSLSKLSQRYYGSATRWQEIYNANTDKIGPTGVLRVGTELRIP